MSEVPKITSTEKTERPEKTKNPKQVEQGKRLAAISRESKERKKQEREKFLSQAESETPWNPGIDENKILIGIGLLGGAFLIYKMFFNREDLEEVKKENKSEDEETENEGENHLLHTTSL